MHEINSMMVHLICWIQNGLAAKQVPREKVRPVLARRGLSEAEFDALVVHLHERRPGWEAVNVRLTSIFREVFRGRRTRTTRQARG